MKNIKDYEDIIDLPHPVSKKYPPFTKVERAAQFAPFAALTGHDDKIRQAEEENETRMANDLEREAFRE